MRPTIFALCAAFILFWSTLLAAEVQAAPPGEATSSPSLGLETGDEPAAGPDESSAKAEGKLIIHKRIWDANSKKWKPATPAHSWTFQVAGGDGNVVAEPTDEDSTPLAAGSYTVTEKSSPPNPAGYALVDFIMNTKGGSNCPDQPKGASQAVSIKKNDFGSKGEGTIHLCAYNRSSTASSQATPPAAKPKLIMEFVSETAGSVTWRLRPSFDAELAVWDEKAESCTAFGGATCDSLASGGSGKFNSTGSGQYFEVTQSYEVKDGKKCEVKNTAEYAAGPFDEPAEPEDKVSAKYECSGASALGWPLLGAGFAAAVVAAWVWRRKRA